MLVPSRRFAHFDAASERVGRRWDHGQEFVVMSAKLRVMARVLRLGSAALLSACDLALPIYESSPDTGTVADVTAPQDGGVTDVSFDVALQTCPDASGDAANLLVNADFSSGEMACAPDWNKQNGNALVLWDGGYMGPYSCELCVTAPQSNEFTLIATQTYPTTGSALLPAGTVFFYSGYLSPLPGYGDVRARFGIEATFVDGGTFSHSFDTNAGDGGWQYSGLVASAPCAPRPLKQVIFQISLATPAMGTSCVLVDDLYLSAGP